MKHISPQVKTSQGPVEGYFESGLSVFKGLPYAAAPVGKLRWQPPRPCRPWTAVRPACQFGPSAPQNPSGASRFKEFVVEGPQSEDCLYLNIWTPGLDKAHRPVMVWIHGGVFTMGSGSQSVFDGSALAARQDVVVVTLNYRLGYFGFLNLNEITFGRLPAHGNEGLLDQIAALVWLKNNISEFGGDPRSITLFGESAGGACIECLMGMPAARGLFDKAILQSNIHQFVPLQAALDGSRLVLRELDVRADDVPALLDLPVEKILTAQKTLNSGDKKHRVNIAPVIDGRNLPTHPLDAFKNGEEADIPLIIGTNREETRLFQALHPDHTAEEDQLLQEIKTLIPAQDPQSVISDYRTALEKEGAASTPAQILVAVQTAVNFRLPALELIKARCAHHSATFAYRFDWQSPALGGILGACHGMEIGFIFGHYDDSFGGSGAEADRLSRQMQQAWAAFARNGRPTCPEIGEWPPYCKNQQTLIFSADTHLDAIKDL